MKKLILLIVLFALFGCKTTKTFTKQQAEIITKTDSAKKSDVVVQILENKKTDTKDTDGTEVVTTEITRIFDTGGTIKSETVKTATRKNNVTKTTIIRDNVNTEITDNSTLAVGNETKVVTQEKTKQTTDTQKTGTNIKWILLSILGLGVVVLILKFTL
ncbi:MAG: hypothetical protein ACYC2P_08730 [Paludibacteraceae bacterium]